MAENDYDIEPKSRGGVSRYLPYAGLFVLTYLIMCAAMYFVLKNRQQERLAQRQAAADSIRAVQEDSLAAALADTLFDTTAVSVDSARMIAELVPLVRREAELDTGLLVQAGEAAVMDSVQRIEQARRLKQLVNIMDKMKPQQTANIISKLDDDFAVEIILRLKDRNAAKVMSALPTSRAARLSEKISRRMSG